MDTFSFPVTKEGGMLNKKVCLVQNHIKGEAIYVIQNVIDAEEQNGIIVLCIHIALFS